MFEDYDQLDRRRILNRILGFWNSGGAKRSGKSQDTVDVGSSRTCSTSAWHIKHHTWGPGYYAPGATSESGKSTVKSCEIVLRMERLHETPEFHIASHPSFGLWTQFDSSVSGPTTGRISSCFTS
jgi:hypothetical protein